MRTATEAPPTRTELGCRRAGWAAWAIPANFMATGHDQVRHKSFHVTKEF